MAGVAKSPSQTIFQRLLFVAYPLRWKGKAMNKKVLWLLTLLPLAEGKFAEAQQPGKVHHVGYLSGRSEAGPLDEVFKTGLAGVGLHRRAKY